MILSIIIPMYNVEKYIEKCILSTQTQDLPSSEYEIICVNDGSPDKSMFIAERLASKYKNIKVISRPNGGLSAARNTGIDNAKGEYIFFLDSDDWIAENCLGKIVYKLKSEEPDILRIAAANVYGDQVKKRRCFEIDTPITGREAFKRNIEPCAPFSIVKSSFLQKNKLRFFEGILHEDSEYSPRLFYCAEKVSFVNDIIYYVYQNPTSITRTVNPKRSFDLINIVCVNISRFCDNVDEDYKTYFNEFISIHFNNALAYISKCPKEMQVELNKSIFQNRFLFQNLKGSSSLKYKTEAFLLDLFPRYAYEVYSLMTILKRK